MHVTRCLWAGGRWRRCEGHRCDRRGTQNVRLLSENASDEAVDPTFRAHTLTKYVPVGRPVVFQVQVLVVLYARSVDHEVPLYNQNWYS